MDELILEAIEEELGVSNDLTKVADEISGIVLSNVESQERMTITNGVQTNSFRFTNNLVRKIRGLQPRI